MPDTVDPLAEQAHEQQILEKQIEPGEKETQDEKKAAFMKRFSASENAPPDLGGKIGSKPNVEHAKNLTDDAKKQADIRAEQLREAEARKSTDKAPPFVKQQIERARAAEAERDKIKSESEAKIADYDKKVAELQSKIDSGDYSTAKEREFQEKITAIESKSQEEKDSLVSENQKLRDRLKVVDLANDPEFEEQYVNPVRDAYKEAIEVIGDDKLRLEALNQALIANATALRATTREEKLGAERQRDNILSQIVEGMPSFSADNFKAAIRGYFKAAVTHATALANNQQTSEQIKQKRELVSNKARADRLASWGKTFDVTGKVYDDKVKLSDEDKKIAKELGIDVDKELQEMTVKARDVAMGNTGMDTALEMVHMGRVSVAKDAKIKVLEKRLSDAEAVLKKLRGASPGGGNDTTPSGVQSGDGKMTREEWQRKRFGVGRNA